MAWPSYLSLVRACHGFVLLDGFVHRYCGPLLPTEGSISFGHKCCLQVPNERRCLAGAERGSVKTLPFVAMKRIT